MRRSGGEQCEKYCPECGHIGLVSDQYLACCPDSAGRYVLPEIARQARVGFKYELHKYIKQNEVL